MLGRVKAWYADPFGEDMDATSWFLFIGLIIVCAILWRLVLNHIMEGIS